jgi:hypothetical protein
MPRIQLNKVLQFSLVPLIYLSITHSLSIWTPKEGLPSIPLILVNLPLEKFLKSKVQSSMRIQQLMWEAQYTQRTQISNFFHLNVQRTLRQLKVAQSICHAL